ncbi:hypothetical protein LguiA_006910 [Lonicera macranthoides]
MASISSEEDDHDQRMESYSLSADVSESESCSALSYDSLLASTSSLTAPEFHSNSDFPLPPPIMLPVVGGRHVLIPPSVPEKPDTLDIISEVALMKERFAKLLLGEDMSGGGQGVGTALAISNAITNLSGLLFSQFTGPLMLPSEFISIVATVFGELWKLEPLAPQKRSMWLREKEWLLCVSDSIVELIPSSQEFPGGRTLEVMVTQPRPDLYINLPALKKLDAMLISILDGFCDSEFYYVDRGIVVDGGEHIEARPWSPSSGRRSVRLEEKWWLPFPKVPNKGLSEDTRKRLQQCRECANQIFKAAVAINNSVLAEMEVPNAYLESLPKGGKTCLGDTLYRYITADQFSPECLLDYLEMSSEYTTLDIANRIEAAVHIWRHRYFKRHLTRAKSGRPSWGGTVKALVGDTEKSKLLAKRAETLLQNLKLQFPGLPQTALDINKIQHNKDVGKSILESYSRVMESLAFNLLARIDDLLYVDDATKQRAAEELVSMLGSTT